MGTTTAFDDKSLGAVAVTLVSVFAVGYLCNAANLPSEVTGAATSVALMVPAALAQRGKGRRAKLAADTPEDPSHPAAAVAKPSVSPLHALILGGAILLLDSILGILAFLFQSDLGFVLVFALELAIIFLAMRRLLDWLGPKPYQTTIAAVGVTVVARLILLVLVPDAADQLGLTGVGEILIVLLITHALFLGAALAGLWRAKGASVGRGATGGPMGATSRTFQAVGSPVDQDALRTPTADAVFGATAPSAPPPPPKGWYADPDLRGIERWWDGTAWSDQRRNRPSPP